MHGVESIVAPSSDAFREACLGRLRPTKILGAVDDWRALARWSPEYFGERMGARQVHVSYSEQGSYDRGTYRTMPMGEFVQHLRSPTPEATREHYYLAGMPAGLHPELAGDYGRPSWVPAGTELNIFFGRDSVTRAHFHAKYHSCLIQLHGRKRVVLYEPGQSALFRPRSILDDTFNFSRLDLRESDLDDAAHPLAGGRSVECELKPGEILFIPVHWWHLVFGRDISISAAYHWRAPWRDWRFPDPGIRSAVRTFLERQPRVLRLLR